MTQPVAKDPTEEVQLGVWQLLKSDAELMSYVKHILDADPDQHDYATIVIPDPITTPDNTHDKFGHQTIVAIHTRVRGDIRDRNRRLDNVIGARVIALLNRQNLALNPLIPSHTVDIIRYEETRPIVEADRSVRHRRDQFRIYTEQD